jgi:hypothetical protein
VDLTVRPRSHLSWEDLRTGVRFLAALPAFLRRPLASAEARAAVQQRLARRADAFLALVRAAAYDHPETPYGPLLRQAGLEFEDVVQLVAADGVEGALHRLAREGVYLTAEELKGRRPVRRGQLTLPPGPGRLRNRRARVHIPLQSGGSRGPAATTGVDLAFMRETNANHRCALEARGAGDWVHAVWDVPGGAALIRLLRLAGAGARPARWFSQIDPAGAELHPRYRWAARALRWGSLVAGAPLPGPEHVPLADALPVARWIAETRRAGRVPHLITSASAALRLAHHAGATGVDVAGAQITVGGEPVTEARRAALRRAGLSAVVTYGSSDTGTAMAHGCLEPAAPDDVHLFDDLFAVVQPGPAAARPGLPAQALLYTSLARSAPLLLLNASLGDQAALAPRACGCPLEAVGWRRHLHTVRSFEKLTIAGMSLLDADLVAVLDQVLPARLGGGPTHYQLIEEQGPDGQPQLRLLVDPAVGPLDPDAVAEAFLAAVGRGAGIERITGLTWRAGGFLTVERRPPESRRGDKILHLLGGPGGAPGGPARGGA